MEFQAFGSYPGKQVVDFEALGKRGLFVVAGPTGSGKTTVFDAMVYALYGAMPGQRSSDGDPRSHHAAADVETCVTLDFEANGARYRVHRAAKWERPKKRGEGTTTQNPTALLSKIVGAGTEPLATQVTACSKMCEELVGLDSRQFQRVVLLPQGKFTQFLIATDEERETLLRQLFGGELYEKAVFWMKDLVKQLDQKVGDVDIELQHHRTNAVEALALVRELWLDDIDDSSITSEGVLLSDLDDPALRTALDDLDPMRIERQGRVDKLRGIATTATAAKISGEAEAKRFADARATESRLVELQAQRDDIERAEHRAGASRRARPVISAANAVSVERELADKAAKELEAVRVAVIVGFEALRRPEPTFDAASLAAAVQQADQQLEADGQLLAAANGAAKKAATQEAELADAHTEHDTLTSKVTATETELAELTGRAESLGPVAAQTDALRSVRDHADQRLMTRRKLDVERSLLEKAVTSDRSAKGSYEELMERFVATQAPRLAESLAAGQPCPVCGSPEHPSPARQSNDDSVDHVAVDDARAKWSSATAVVTRYETEIDTMRTSLIDEAEQPLEQFESALSEANSALSTAETAATDLVNVSAGIKAKTSEAATAASTAQAMGKRLADLGGVARTKRAEADRLAAEASAIDADALAVDLETASSLKDSTVDVSELFDAATGTRVALEKAEARLAETLVEGEFTDVDAAATAALDPQVESEFEERAAAWHKKLDEQQTRLRQLNEQGVPETRPDVESLVTAAEAANTSAALVAGVFTTASNALDAATRELDKAIDIAAGSADLRYQRDTARIVFRTCNGEAGIRVKLERWVLAGELDRVTEAANVHLARMTNHRYRLGRSTGSRGGLTLEVFDAHTGRARTTVSLSGGEQFQASLSLALGLADVVSRGGAASGRQFEALFVDEGFGSLDSDALDDAIRALALLQEAGRTVGVITHVEAMKQQLHVGIEVERLPDGKGSTLVVNP